MQWSVFVLTVFVNGITDSCDAAVARVDVATVGYGALSFVRSCNTTRHETT